MCIFQQTSIDNIFLDIVIFLLSLIHKLKYAELSGLLTFDQISCVLPRLS